jgi:ABC-type lipoprotein release transport system permease subunit
MLSYFIRSVAFRHLRYSVGQSFLTIGVVAISVLLIIYLRTIIGGTQTRIVQNTTGAIPHIAGRRLAADEPGHRLQDPLRRRSREPAEGA